MRLPLIIGVVGFSVAVITLATGGFGMSASFGTFVPVAVVFMFMLAFYLSAQRKQNEPRCSLKQEQEADKPVSQLKHASASASTRQSVEEKSAWS
tara:strand:+ start:12123 stop:12407 length:285 start_codon:yes stop_codon:yes gene_type:complete